MAMRYCFDRELFEHDLRDWVGNMSLRSASSISGISASTLSRVLNGSTPELDTFAQLCLNMNVNVSNYFYFRMED